jgi:hypothetical protein
LNLNQKFGFFTSTAIKSVILSAAGRGKEEDCPFGRLVGELLVMIAEKGR